MFSVFRWDFAQMCVPGEEFDKSVPTYLTVTGTLNLADSRQTIGAEMTDCYVCRLLAIVLLTL